MEKKRKKCFKILQNLLSATFSYQAYSMSYIFKDITKFHITKTDKCILIFVSIITIQFMIVW